MGRNVEGKQTINFSKALRLLIQSNKSLSYSIIVIVPFMLMCVLFIYTSLNSKKNEFKPTSKMYHILRTSTHYNSI